MSGHNKWSTIKHKKAASDARRGREFTRVIREITVAARSGGGDPGGNPRLRSAVMSAKAINMPLDNVKRAIQRGTGELPGVTYEEITYEAYGPEGVALLMEVLTDNPNRTTPEIRHLLAKNGGNLGSPNSVAWIFEKKGYLEVDAATAGEEQIMDVALEAGAEDIEEVDGVFEVYTPVDAFEAVSKAITDAGMTLKVARISRIPSTTVKVSGRKADQLIRLLEALDDHDDIQRVWGNMELEETDPAQD
ncbi:MAG: YebC/PmpR family DNA-binding transcriptional regulator [Acidobacteria bacterium]|nr:MAG: YebC/PmpR family DNA-binding transcriptional regulator [Acidobacteriota bacterium]